MTYTDFFWTERNVKMNLHTITTAALLAASSFGISAEQCKVKASMDDSEAEGSGLVLVGRVLYGIKRATKVQEQAVAHDTLVVIELESGTTREIDLGPTWRYRGENIEAVVECLNDIEVVECLNDFEFDIGELVEEIEWLEVPMPPRIEPTVRPALRLVMG
jgi:hypothetical protein